MRERYAEPATAWRMRVIENGRTPGEQIAIMNGMSCIDVRPMPEFVRACHPSDVAGQRIDWSSAKPPWPDALRGHDELRDALESEVHNFGGIRRGVVFGCADRPPIEIFLAAMAWRLGTTNVRSPRPAELLRAEGTAPQLAEIIRHRRATG